MKDSDKNVHDRDCQFHVFDDKLHSSALFSKFIYLDLMRIFSIQEKTLGSFQPKLMTKIEVISQKPSKKLDFWQKWQFFDSFWPKMANF